MNQLSNVTELDVERLELNYESVVARIACMESAAQERYPFAVIERLCDGENPVAVWREYRAMTPDDLAARSGISVGALQRLEGGFGEQPFRLMATIAKALDIDMELLLPPAQD